MPRAPAAVALRALGRSAARRGGRRSTIQQQPLSSSSCAPSMAPLAAVRSHTQGQQRFSSSSTAAAATTSASESSHATPPPLFEDPRLAILEAALAQVPEHGWSDNALAAGAAAVGFPAVAHGMFGRGAVELVEHFTAQVNKTWLDELAAREGELRALPSARDRLKLAVQLRLRLIAPHLAQWPQALALGLHPQNLEATARGLALVADELCFAAALQPQEESKQQPQEAQAQPQEAGATGVLGGGAHPTGLDWYAQRATVGSLYAATELFFLTDYSEDYSDTWTFLDRRLEDLESLTHAPRNVQEGVLALHTAAGALASAAASLAQPAVWAALQRVPVSGAMVGALQTALANVAAMAPPSVEPFQQAAAASSGKTSSDSDFPPPHERDPYEGKNKGAGGKAAPPDLGLGGGSGSASGSGANP